MTAVSKHARIRLCHDKVCGSQNILTGKKTVSLPKGSSHAKLYARARDELNVPRSHSLRVSLAVPWIEPQCGESCPDVTQAFSDNPVTRHAGVYIVSSQVYSSM